MAHQPLGNLPGQQLLCMTVWAQTSVYKTTKTLAGVECVGLALKGMAEQCSTVELDD